MAFIYLLFVLNVLALLLIAARRWPLGARSVVGLLVFLVCAVFTFSPLHIPSLDLKLWIEDQIADKLFDPSWRLLGPFWSPPKNIDVALVTIAILQFLLLLAYIVAAWVFIKLVSVTYRLLPYRGQSWLDRENELWQDFLEKIGVRMAIGTAAACIGLCYSLIPLIVEHELFVSKSGRIDPTFSGHLLYSIPWVGMAIFGFEVLGTDNLRKRQSEAKTDKKIFDFDKLFKRLNSEFGSGAILGSGAIPADNAMQECPRSSRPGWVAELEREFSDKNSNSGEHGVQVTEVLAAELAKIEEQLRSQEPAPVIIEESLTEQKLAIFASILRHCRDRGKSSLVILDYKKVDGVVEGLRKAESELNHPIAAEWHRISTNSTPRFPDCVLFGTVDEIDEQLFAVSQHYQPGSAAGRLRPVLDRLGTVLILEVQSIDIAQVGLKLELLRRSVGEAKFRSLNFVAQAEEMESFSDGISNTLFRRKLNQSPIKVRLAPSREFKKRVIVWDYDVNKRENYKQADRSQPMFCGPMAAIAASEAAIIHIAKDREAGFPHGKYVSAKVEAVPSGRNNNGLPAVYMERDQGNLATALAREMTGARHGGALLNILSEPSPFRSQLLSVIRGENGDIAEAVGNKEVLKPFVPKVPDAVGGLREVMRTLAYAFLAAPGQKLTEQEIRTIIEGFKKYNCMFSDTVQIENGKLRKFEIEVLASSLTRLFHKTTGVQVVLNETIEENYQRSIEAAHREQLNQVAHGNVIEVQCGSDVLRFPEADEGLDFSNDVHVVLNRTPYRMNKTWGRRGYTLISDKSNQYWDNAGRYVYSRNYEINNVHLIGAMRQSWYTVGLVHMDVRRKTVGRHFVHSAPGKTTHTGETLREIEHDWFAQAAVMRFRLTHREANEADTEAANSSGEHKTAKSSVSAHESKICLVNTMCITLQDVLKQKFPSVAHRLAVASPQGRQALSRRPGDPAGLAGICCIDIERTQLEIIRHHFELQHIGENLTDIDHEEENDIVELFVIEDSDSDLGVVWHLRQSAGNRPEGVLRTWIDFLEYCANAPVDPYGRNRKFGFQMNYESAFSIVAGKG